jgi:hypothetical protein
MRGESPKWAKIGALLAVAAALIAAVGLYFQYINQPSMADVVLTPVGYTVSSTSDGQFVTVKFTLTAVGAYPAQNVRINPACEAVIPKPERVLPDQWKPIGDLVPGKSTPVFCFITLTYRGAIAGIKQSNTITWKNAVRPKVCSFDIHHITVNNKELDVPSPCM